MVKNYDSIQDFQGFEEERDHANGFFDLNLTQIGRYSAAQTDGGKRYQEDSMFLANSGQINDPQGYFRHHFTTMVRQNKGQESGTTAALYYFDPAKRQITTANLGDSRVYLTVRNPVNNECKTILLTQDHEPNLDRIEAEIKRKGGYVSPGFWGNPPRVNGHLAVGAAIGDYAKGEGNHMLTRYDEKGYEEIGKLEHPPLLTDPDIWTFDIFHLANIVFPGLEPDTLEFTVTNACDGLTNHRRDNNCDFEARAGTDGQCGIFEVDESKIHPQSLSNLVANYHERPDRTSLAQYLRDDARQNVPGDNISVSTFDFKGSEVGKAYPAIRPTLGGVFDGHGGDKAAQNCVQYMRENYRGFEMRNTKKYVEKMNAIGIPSELSVEMIMDQIKRHPFVIDAEEYNTNDRLLYLISLLASHKDATIEDQDFCQERLREIIRDSTIRAENQHLFRSSESYHVLTTPISQIVRSELTVELKLQYIDLLCEAGCDINAVNVFTKEKEEDPWGAPDPNAPVYKMAGCYTTPFYHATRQLLGRDTSDEDRESWLKICQKLKEKGANPQKVTQLRTSAYDSYNTRVKGILESPLLREIDKLYMPVEQEFDIGKISTHTLPTKEGRLQKQGNILRKFIEKSAFIDKDILVEMTKEDVERELRIDKESTDLLEGGMKFFKMGSQAYVAKPIGIESEFGTTLFRYLSKGMYASKHEYLFRGDDGTVWSMSKYDKDINKVPSPLKQGQRSRSELNFDISSPHVQQFMQSYARMMGVLHVFGEADSNPRNFFVNENGKPVKIDNSFFVNLLPQPFLNARDRSKEYHRIMGCAQANYFFRHDIFGDLDVASDGFSRDLDLFNRNFSRDDMPHGMDGYQYWREKFAAEFTRLHTDNINDDFVERNKEALESPEKKALFDSFMSGVKDAIELAEDVGFMETYCARYGDPTSQERQIADKCREFFVENAKQARISLNRSLDQVAEVAAAAPAPVATINIANEIQNALRWGFRSNEKKETIIIDSYKFPIEIKEVSVGGSRRYVLEIARPTTFNTDQAAPFLKWIKESIEGSGILIEGKSAKQDISNVRIEIQDLKPDFLDNLEMYQCKLSFLDREAGYSESYKQSADTIKKLCATLSADNERKPGKSPNLQKERVDDRYKERLDPKDLKKFLEDEGFQCEIFSAPEMGGEGEKKDRYVKLFLTNDKRDPFVVYIDPTDHEFAIGCSDYTFTESELTIRILRKISQEITKEFDASLMEGAKKAQKEDFRKWNPDLDDDHSQMEGITREGMLYFTSGVIKAVSDHYRAAEAQPPEDIISREQKHDAIHQFIERNETIFPNREVANHVAAFQAAVEENRNNPQPKTPYRGIGVKAEVIEFDDDSQGLEIKDVFSPENIRFNIDPKDLTDSYITSVVIDDRWVAVSDLLQQENGLEKISAAFHDDGEVKFEVMRQDEVGKWTRKVVKCNNSINKTAIYSAQDEKSLSEIAAEDKNHFYEICDSAVTRGEDLGRGGAAPSPYIHSPDLVGAAGAARVGRR